MSKTVLLNVRTFAVGIDLTGVSNKIELSSEVEAKETTNYGSEGYKEVVGGLTSAEISGEGQWEAGDVDKVDDASWAQLGGVGPWTVCGQGSSFVGDLAYFVKALRCNHTIGGEIGEVAPWTASVKSAWPLVRGVVMHPPGTARTSSGSGTGIELGAVLDGQQVYASLHVLSVSGTTPSLTVSLESAADDTFTSPTTWLTFDAASAVGGQIMRVPGPGADTWWRLVWTVSGTTPSFLFTGAVGIR
ncbi:hypothetical protein [Streptomyces sp. HGB0020]|jgi:hypothetical protein|uniref:hypothetical protein n=1 Tax=Streptomyces sp. HGB0020 TaxID=1078086 RepID=UPI00034E0070|nr:hypothetical protein [Streptomyces sp. HGB0020]EPD56356.1 hypothetical protein HMPREF1211_07476 [Streptomyces sp. HGB0020]